jgi:hypothetical protein
VEYRPIQSRFGELWVHRCVALKDGAEWARRERLAVDAGASDSRVTYRGRSIRFHAHFFREPDGLFRVSARDQALYPPGLLTEIEQIVNSAL